MKTRIIIFAVLLMLALFGGCRFQPDYVPNFDEIPKEVNEKP